MVDKRNWERPAAWAITQNEHLWEEFDSVADRRVIVEWSLADNYRTHMMEPGDPALFWITGKNGGIARLGFVLGVRETRRGAWRDAAGKRHKAPYSGEFFLPPFPNRRYIHRSALADRPQLSKCELLGSGSQMQAPLRIEQKEWVVIQQLLRRFDRTNEAFRAPWSK